MGPNPKKLKNENNCQVTRFKGENALAWVTQSCAENAQKYILQQLIFCF